MVSRKVKRKNKKTLRRRYKLHKLHRGAGSPMGSKSSNTPPEEESYDDAELLTTSPEHPESSPSASSLTVR